MDVLNFNSVETVPGLNASAAFQVDSGKVFKEDCDIVPTVIDKSLSYMPWGGDNMMPYNILKLIEDDETLSTCQQFNAEVCYGSGLKYDTEAMHTTASSRSILSRWVRCVSSRLNPAVLRKRFSVSICQRSL